MARGTTDSTALTTVREEASDIDAGESVLVLGPAGRAPVDAVCGELLNRYAPADTHYVAVTFQDSPSDRLEHWQDHVGQLPRAASIVVVSQGRQAGDDLPESVTVEHVPDASDVPRLGITINEVIDADPENVVCCFDGLTPFLQYAELQRVYRFVHTLKGRLGNVAGVGHYHMNRAAHDDQTLATLHPLFDVVVEIDQDGSAEVR